MYSAVIAGEYVQVKGLRVYDFQPIRKPVIDKWIAEEIIQRKPGSVMKLSYPGLEVSIVVELDEVVFKSEGSEYSISINDVRKAADSDKMYMLDEGILIPLEVRRKGYYKLLPVAPGKPPTIEINGIHMHRITNTDPEKDTLAKIRAARIRPGVRVLDVCTGLGYTAIYSVKKGAASVVTIEVDDAVLYLAERNPWSRLLSDERIRIIHEDATKVLPRLDDESFDRIIHDPPRLTSSTGDLYGLTFYRELYRVLKPGGVLFHYTGTPGKLRKINLPGKVSSRLEKAGFIVRYFDRRALGVVAVKPR